MPSPQEWSRAFAEQARADLSTYNVCCLTPTTPLCHRYHFLQMACEKVAKAHLCAAGSDPMVIQASDAYTAKVLPIVVRQEITRMHPAAARKMAWIVHRIGPLLREVELLSPSVDDGGLRPANCEYPWADNGGAVRVPSRETFPNLASLYTPLGRELLRLIDRATKRLALGTG